MLASAGTGGHIRLVRGIIALCAAAVLLLPGYGRCDYVELGTGLSQPALNNIEQPWAVGPSWRITYIHPLNGRLLLLGGLGYSRYLNDTTSTATIRFLLPNRLASENWRLFSLDFGVQYNFDGGQNTTPYLRGLLGNTFWNVQRLGGTTVRVTDGSGAPADFGAQEVVLKGALGLHYQFHPRFGLAVEGEIAYFTGIGADFSERVDNARSRATGTLYLKWTYDWGAVTPTPIKALAPPETPRRGVEEIHRATTADSLTSDSDGDGVVDAVDRCAETPVEARGWVDVNGCPVDTDRDGVADYADRCPNSPAGARVTAEGCMADADGDGVDDEADECPGTEAGAKVDARGCPDYEPLADKIVFNFKYASGASELDADARAQLGSLVPRLKYNPEVRIVVRGYTDDIGPADANQALSQKRADRVKAFLVSQGVPARQIAAEGKGETDFVASNSTREGRAQNRRIELVPVK